MKRILIAIHYLEIGGAETSLMGLLDSMDWSKVSVDLFVYSHRGELMGMIPSQVNLLPEIPEYAQIERPLKDVLCSRYWRIALARLIAKLQFRHYIKRNSPKDGSAIFSYVAKNVTPLLPNINPHTKYDVAVSYLAPHDIVLNKVNAAKKICWVHTDYTSIDVDTCLELPVWSGYDKITAVSGSVSDAFLATFPSLHDKMQIIPNRVSESFVKKRAAEIPPSEVEKEMPIEAGEVRLLSVGRFTKAKNFDSVPEICKRIWESGVKVRWYIIGFGSDGQLIQRRITEAGMEGKVILLGKKSNPYPYMLSCDFYVQPSRYEGSPMTLLEAMSLGRPVIVTEYPTLDKSAIKNGNIVPMEPVACAAGIVNAIKQ